MSESTIISALMSLVNAGLLSGSLVYARPGSELATFAATFRLSHETDNSLFYDVVVNTDGLWLTVAVPKR